MDLYFQQCIWSHVNVYPLNVILKLVAFAKSYPSQYSFDDVCYFILIKLLAIEYKMSWLV